MNTNNNMTVLVIGSGGREHALWHACKQSPLVAVAICAPGNAGMPLDCRRDVELESTSIVSLARELSADLVVIGPEAPLAAGVADSLRKAGIPVFGPSKDAAELEVSKTFTKLLCREYGILTAEFWVVSDFESGSDIIVDNDDARVIKADGLAAGKGVLVASCDEDAFEALEQLLAQYPPTVLIEERLVGREVSVMAICDGEHAVLLPPARDHKRAYDGDTGPNTGGMGAYSPVPDVDDALLERIREDIILPTLAAMRVKGRPFRGLLYAGIMVTDAGDPYLLEYNVRFGDPETQVILPRLDCDVVPYLLAAAVGDLSSLPPLAVSPQAVVCVVMASQGYPGKYETGHIITGLDSPRESSIAYHAGTRWNGDVVTAGGRVLGVVGRGDTLALARAAAYAYVEEISFGNHVSRTDIAAGVG